MKIAVLDDYQRAFRTLPCYARLKDHEVVVFQDSEKDPARLAERLKDVDAVILTQQRSAFRRTVIEKLSGLKLVAQTGSHRDHLDIAACTEKGIIVAAPSAIGVGITTAELAWGLILASLRHIPQEVEQLKKGVWQTTVGTGLRGKTLGVYALGQIGQLVAQVGKAFGMRVTCWGRESSRAKVIEAGYEMPATREEFFAGADIVSLHIFYNEQTRGIVTAADLACMKSSALLVNTSRAGLIQKGALVEALTRGRPGRAAVDVYEEEPVLNGDHPLLKMSNVMCTPHLGYVADTTFDGLYNIAIDSILGFAAGKPVNVLNPEVLR
jgi:D-3-phosphoglycerate dehydrogenase